MHRETKLQFSKRSATTCMGILTSLALPCRLPVTCLSLTCVFLSLCCNFPAPPCDFPTLASHFLASSGDCRYTQSTTSHQVHACTPPPLYKLRQCTQLLQSLRLL